VVCYSLRGLAALLVFSLVRLLIAVAGFHFVNRNSSRNLQTSFRVEFCLLTETGLFCLAAMSSGFQTFQADTQLLSSEDLISCNLNRLKVPLDVCFIWFAPHTTNRLHSSEPLDFKADLSEVGNLMPVLQ